MATTAADGPDRKMMSKIFIGSPLQNLFSRPSGTLVNSHNLAVNPLAAQSFSRTTRDCATRDSGAAGTLTFA